MEQKTESPQSGARYGRFWLGSIAALVVIVAGMKAAASLIVPFLCAAILAVLVAPPVFWLQRRRCPLWLAILLVMSGVLVLEVAIGLLLGNSINDFIAVLPDYQQQLTTRFAGVLEQLGASGVDTRHLSLNTLLDPAKAMGWTATLLSSLTGLLGNTVLILFTVVFLLFEAAEFPAKIRAALGREAPLAEFERFAAGLNRYMVIKAATSLGTAVLTGLLLALLGVPFAVLWGVLTFFLHFVPNIGSIIAAVPPVLLALVGGGVGTALLVVAGAVAINLVVGNIIEPRYLGRGLGLSTLVVFVSLVFWGWVFGAIGMLLSVPLTMALKIALEATPATRWAAVFLGTGE